MTNSTENGQGFSDLGISPGLLKRLRELGFSQPTPIQCQAIPAAASGEDLVGIAQTGSGKTLAFSIPMLQRISATKKIGLVLLPTRELAVQVEETLAKLAGKLGLRTALLIGGTNPSPQIRKLKAKPHVIVATPGRLLDLADQKKASLSNVGSLVLDEADRMLDMGFAPQLNRILKSVPKERQTMLFSATMPPEIAEIAKSYMRQPLRIEVSRPGTTADRVDQEMYIVPRTEKLDLMKRLLKEYRGSVLVFSRTKYGASKLARKLRQAGHEAAEIHSNRSQAQRQKALKGFANGTYRVLVATDIAARGIDVDDVELVLNFDLPMQAEDYVHRIGRTARAGKAGKAISFAMPEQTADILQIQKLIKTAVPLRSATGEKLEPLKPAASRPKPAKKSGGNRRNRGHRNGGARPESAGRGRHRPAARRRPRR